MLDISNVDTGLPVAYNIPLITGLDILEGLEYLEIGGSMFVLTDGNQLAVPTYENLGVESFLFFQVVD